MTPTANDLQGGGVPPLAAMGRRIAIMGPSNAGKSTLARALGIKLGIEQTHLDLLRHRSDGHWIERPDAEFHALHDTIVAQEQWIIDGNYSALMARRLARATGIVVVDDTYLKRTYRYIRRTVFEQRAGGIEGVHERITGHMLAWL